MPHELVLDYQRLFDALPQSYVVFEADDPTFTIVGENLAHEAVALVNRRDVIGRPLLKAFPDTSKKYKQTGVSDLVESLRTVIKTGRPDAMAVLRYDLKNQEGELETRYWQVTHHPLKDIAGNVTHIYQETVNISNQITSDRRLDEIKRQLDEALSFGMIGTWLWNLTDDYVVADKNLLRMFGLTPEEAVEGLPLQTFTESIHPDDRARVKKSIKSAIRHKSHFEEEYRTMTQNDDIRWVIARGRVELENGKPVRFPGVVVDITDRKFAEQNARYLAQVSTALSSSLDYTRTLRMAAKLAVPQLADWCTIDLLENGVIRSVAIAHRDPKKISWAKRYRESQPISIDDPTGAAAVIRTGTSEFYPVITDEMLVASAQSPEHLELIRDLKLTSAMTIPLKVRGEVVGAVSFLSSTMQRHYTQEDLAMAEEMAGRAAMAISNARLYATAQQEIANRARLEDKLRQANEDLEKRVRSRTSQLRETNSNLERSNQELQDFAYVASHDLQEPLRKIQAFGNLLETEHGAQLGEGSDYLDRMRNAASRMSVLIEDLLTFSRVTTKASPMGSVDLNIIAREVVDDLEVRIQDTAGSVEISILPTVTADSLQMRQLLQNLIGNALKFAKPDTPPQVRVYAEIEKPRTMTAGTDTGTMSTCRLYIADNGIGFDEKYLDRIFSVFQRLHSKETYQGTGIGLAICRKIAERHGGTITAQSKSDHGSTFIVTLPINTKGTGGQA